MSAPRNVVLAGLMGSGKSAVGNLLAHWLERQFVDTDALIATATGKTVPALFEEQGEAAFRALEAEAVEAVCERVGLIVAVGGGAVLDPGNAAKLRDTCLVLVLDATSEELAARIEGGRRAGQRPLLDGVEDVAGRLEALRRERERAYAEVAHVTFDTTAQPVERVAATIAAWLEEHE